MSQLELKIPPLLLVVIFAVLMWFTTPYVIRLDMSASLSMALLIAFITLGVMTILLGALAFKKAQTTVNPTKPETSSALVRDGVYRFTRNPMYVGMALILIGWACFLKTPTAIVFVMAFVFYMNRFQIEPEEKMLTKIFPQEYSQYCEKVRRWI